MHDFLVAHSCSLACTLHKTVIQLFSGTRLTPGSRWMLDFSCAQAASREALRACTPPPTVSFRYPGHAGKSGVTRQPSASPPSQDMFEQPGYIPRVRMCRGLYQDGHEGGKPIFSVTVYLSVNTHCRWVWPWHMGFKSNWVQCGCLLYTLRIVLFIFLESCPLWTSHLWASVTCNRQCSTLEGYGTHFPLGVSFAWQLTAAGATWHLPWPGTMPHSHTLCSEPFSLK